MEVVAAHPSVRKFINTLQDPEGSKTLRLLETLSEKGPNLGMPLSRYLGDHLFELRVLGARSVRILYTPYNNRIFLLHAFVKKSQKVSKHDLKLARARLAHLRTI